MGLFISFSIGIIFLNIFIIGIILSKIRINIEDLVMYSNFKVGRIQFTIDVYLFKKIKIISIHFYNEYFKIAFIKIYYKKILRYKNQIIDNCVTLIKLLIGKNKLSLSLLNPEIELFYMYLIISTKNAAVTSISSSLIGTTTSIVLSKYMKKFDERKIYYRIVPTFYNVNGFNFKLKSIIDFDTFYILLFVYDYFWLKNNNLKYG